MKDHPGYLQELPLMGEILSQTSAYEVKETLASYCMSQGFSEHADKWATEDLESVILSVLEVLRRRGLINEQGLEIIKGEME